ncbi:MAG: hypothetical protein ACFFCZ_16145 [Promethearchaeota archaeon]
MSTEEETDIALKKILASIVQSFKDYFIDAANTLIGKRPEELTFEEISLDRKIGTTGIKLVNVRFSCPEARNLMAGLAVKNLESPSEVELTIKKINFLHNRIEPWNFLGLCTPNVIFNSGSLIILEGIMGSDSFRHSPVPEIEKMRLAGRALGAIHGPQKAEVFFEQYRIVTRKAIDLLPVSGKWKEELIMLFDLQFDDVEKYTKYGGSIKFGDFHAGNILFEINRRKSPILRTHLIDPEFLTIEETHTDRFEDISNFFVHRAITEYRTTKKLEKTPKDILSFLSGYNEILAYSNANIYQFYDNVLPVNFHLAQAILLSILNYLSLPEAQNEAHASQEIELRLGLIRHLLRRPAIVHRVN